MRSILFILLSVVILSSCKKEDDLMKSVYIEDPDSPGMPAYTEWGYNTFGALYGREVFSYTDDEVPLNIIIKDDSISFIFQGEYKNEYMAVHISFPEDKIASHKDLLSYQGKKIDILNLGGKIRLDKGNSTNTDIQKEYIRLISANIEFKRVQNVIIDGEEEMVIISGYFDFQFFDDDIPVSVYDGRFDFGVNESIFFNLP